MRISDWSSDVCSSDLGDDTGQFHRQGHAALSLLREDWGWPAGAAMRQPSLANRCWSSAVQPSRTASPARTDGWPGMRAAMAVSPIRHSSTVSAPRYSAASTSAATRSEEHTYDLQSLMRISYAVFC